MAESAKVEGDKFVSVMQDFVEKGEQQLKAMDIAIEEMTTSLTELAEGYGEDVKNLLQNPSEFFGVLNQFFDDFTNSHLDFKRKMESEKKKKEKDEKDKKKKEEKEKKALTPKSED